jgi:HAD superfamily hydrolase (TIGR01450 family)
MMAVILAAGFGSRLKDLLVDKPKCLVRVNGRSILDHQLDALLATEIEKVYIVAGFRGDVLRAHVRTDPRIQFVENADFLMTNNMYSLFLCREHVAGRDFILMNGDVVFDPSIIRDLCRQERSSICVDVGSYSEESMKVVLPVGGDHLSHISKKIPKEEALGSSTDVYLFRREESARLFEHLTTVIEQQHRLKEWTELAIDELMQAGKLAMRPYAIAGRNWYEIDNVEDLRHAETMFGRSHLHWEEIKICFVDMDGTLYRGSQPIPGADHFIRQIRQRVPHVYFLSNNSSATHSEYSAKLQRFNIPARESDIVLSSDALGSFLQQQGLTAVYLVGTRSLEQLLRDRYGIKHHPTKPQAVVLGYDKELTYAKLAEAALFLQAGLPYCASHIDVVCPTERGNIPDIGSMIALLEKATGRTPQQTFGKPNRELVQAVFDKTGVAPEHCIFIGDRVYTDYALARNCGARFIGVLSGESTRKDYEPCENLTIFPSVAEIFPA